MERVKRIDIKEFREKGYLQEVNRNFLHPLGLALEIVIEDDGGMRLGGVWDYRDDPEGILYGVRDREEITEMIEKARYVETQRLAKISSGRNDNRFDSGIEKLAL